MYTFTLSAGSLRAALLCAGKKDIRYCLNGVYLDGARGAIVGTDGHRMFVCRADIPEGVSVIVGRDFLEKALKLDKRAESVSVTVKPAEPGAAGERAAAFISLMVGTALLSEREVDGTYPNYPLVIPTAVSGEPAVYDPKYLVEGVEALRLAAGLKKLDGAPMAYNGNGAGVMHLGAEAEAIVLIMPVRGDMVDNVFPHVFRPTAADADAAADAAAGATAA